MGKVDLIEQSKWTFLNEMVSKCLIFCYSLSGFSGFLFSYLSCQICLVFLTGSFDKLLLVCFQVDNSRGSIDADPTLHIFWVKWKSIYQNDGVSGCLNQCMEMSSDFVERQFFSIFRCYKFFFYRGNIRIVFNMSVTELTAYEFRSTCFTWAWSSTNQHVLSVVFCLLT